jgi:hypothetical protein
MKPFTGAERAAAGAVGVAAGAGKVAAAGAERAAVGAGRAVAGAGIGLERRALDRVLESGELERLLGNPRLHAAFRQLVESDGAKTLVDAFFDSGLFGRVVDRLLAGDDLWRLVDEIAGSPAVTRAISQQGLGFADQVGAEVRGRSRRADDWLEGRARRLIHRRAEQPAANRAPAAQ